MTSPPTDKAAWSMSLMGKLRWAVRHPAASSSPATVLTRLAVWRLRTALGIGATVRIAGAGARFRCPPEWRGNAKMMYVWRDDYESELSQLHRWVGPGDLAVDVGAHYGSYSLALARLVGDEGHVVALEPALHARSVLSRNLRINGLKHVAVVGAAAGDDTAWSTLHLHGDLSRASLCEPRGDGPGAEQVKVVRLDDVMPPGRRVSFIKMDVEGYEVRALKGAAGILARDHPVVVFELLPGTAVSAGHGAWDLLASHGYRMYRVSDEGEVIPVEDPARRHGWTNNVVAVHPSPAGTTSALLGAH